MIIGFATYIFIAGRNSHTSGRGRGRGFHFLVDQSTLYLNSQTYPYRSCPS